MNDLNYVQIGVAFVVVIVLLVVVLWLLKRIGGGRLSARGQRRLSIQEIAVVDPKRRLVLVRRDEAEHLILIGGPNDLLLESVGSRSAQPVVATDEPYTRAPIDRSAYPRSSSRPAATSPATSDYSLPPIVSPQPAAPQRSEPSFGQHLKDRL